MSSSSLPDRADFARILTRSRAGAGSGPAGAAGAAGGAARVSHRALIAPSLLAADFGLIADEIARAEEAGADILHLDVMDGHFVPNLTMGPAMVKAVRRRTELPLDVHLMITDPGAFVSPFADAGADHLTFHVEVMPHRGAVEGVVSLMRGRGLGVGISLRPGTPAERVLPHLDLVDMLLVMSVDPGFGGQPFIPDSLPRLAAFRAHRERAGLRFVIEVDGGIDSRTAGPAAGAGAEILVAGTALYGPGDMTDRVRAMRMAADAASAPG